MIYPVSGVLTIGIEVGINRVLTVSAAAQRGEV